jgi:hypothetical protein
MIDCLSALMKEIRAGTDIFIFMTVKNPRRKANNSEKIWKER